MLVINKKKLFIMIYSWTNFCRQNASRLKGNRESDEICFYVAKLRRKAQKETLAASTILSVICCDNFSVWKICLMLHVGTWKHSSDRVTDLILSVIKENMDRDKGIALPIRVWMMS